MDSGRPFQRPRSVHGVDVDPFGAGESVEQVDRVLATVSGEVTVVAVDHREACSHVAREVEGGDAGTKREGRERVPEIVDAPRWGDSGCALRWLPVSVAEVVQIEVAALGDGNTSGERQFPGSRSSAASAIACSGTARTLASVFGHLTRPFLYARRTYATRASRSMSRCSSPIQTPGRSPVAAAKSTSGP